MYSSLLKIWPLVLCATVIWTNDPCTLYVELQYTCSYIAATLGVQTKVQLCSFGGASYTRVLMETAEQCSQIGWKKRTQDQLSPLLEYKECILSSASLTANVPQWWLRLWCPAACPKDVGSIPVAAVSFWWRRNARGLYIVRCWCTLKNPRLSKLTAGLHYSISCSQGFFGTTNFINDGIIHKMMDLEGHWGQLCKMFVHSKIDSVTISGCIYVFSAAKDSVCYWKNSLKIFFT